MPDIIIYHNGQCSKSKGALEYLQESGVLFAVRWYITDPLQKEELVALLGKLGMQPSEITRKGKPEYKENFEGRTPNEDELLAALLQYPVLLERPIIVRGNKAIIARPPELVKDFIR